MAKARTTRNQRLLLELQRLHDLIAVEKQRFDAVRPVLNAVARKDWIGAEQAFTNVGDFSSKAQFPTRRKWAAAFKNEVCRALSEAPSGSRAALIRKFGVQQHMAYGWFKAWQVKPFVARAGEPEYQSNTGDSESVSEVLTNARAAFSRAWAGAPQKKWRTSRIPSAALPETPQDPATASQPQLQRGTLHRSPSRFRKL